nr:type IIL restriction-modification enzyme MmeI [Sphingomonas sp. HMP6]
MSASEKARFLESEGFDPAWLRKFIGGEEYINDGIRFCLWLKDARPDALRSCPAVLDRLKSVARARADSDKARTKWWADYPTLFTEDRQPTSQYLLVPKVSSQRRQYVPMGIVDEKTIVSGSAQFVQDADNFTFGLMTSSMHMTWMKAVGGRTKSDYQYTNTLVYNTFPWPDATPAQRTKIEALAQAVLDARLAHPTASLADLYDPDTMPGDLRKAHHALDLAVDRLYRATPFASDRDRVEHLFGRYEALVNPLATAGVKANKRVARNAAK